MGDVKVFVVEVLEDTEINGASYEKGRRFKFDNKIPSHIQDVIDAGNAEDITATLTAEEIASTDEAKGPVEPTAVAQTITDDPKVEEEVPASSEPSGEQSPAAPSAPEAPENAPATGNPTAPAA